MTIKNTVYWRWLNEFLLFILTLFVISVLTFSLVKFTPGDPAANYLRASHIMINDETLANARLKLGLDKPILEQYTTWLTKILQGDFGESYIKGDKVITIMQRAVMPTLTLGAFSFVILFFFSLFFGILSALYHHKWLDYLVQIFSYFSISVPTFWLGYMLIIIFAVQLKLLPVSGKGDFSNYILPAITLVTPLLGQTTLLIRKAILEEMNSPHAENARIRGVAERYIVFNHLLRNASITIITVFSSNILYLCTGSIIIEEIFSWPGLGKMFTGAAQHGDIPLIQASLLFFGVFAIVVNSLTQKLVHNIDPHLKLAKGGEYAQK